MYNHSVQVGWLDLSDSEQRRAREYLRQFRTEGTLDELGFGIVRDALADVFFPATNTIMTRSRYLFFVAAALLRVEHERLSGAQAARRLKMLEDGLRKILSRDSTDEDDAERRGVIGALAKENLRRYPSSIYWNALKRLGLFQRQEWGLTYYLDHLADYYKVNTPKRDDDGLAHLPIATLRNWDSALNDVLASTPGLSLGQLLIPLPDRPDLVHALFGDPHPGAAGARTPPQRRRLPLLGNVLDLDEPLALQLFQADGQEGAAVHPALAQVPEGDIPPPWTAWGSCQPR